MRWGLPDVVLAWLAGVAASFLALPLADPNASTSEQPMRFLLAGLFLQNAGIVAALIVISKRKGRGSLDQDFGFVWPFDRLRPAAVFGWLAAGAGLSLAAQVILAPISWLADLDEPAQEVSKALERAGGAPKIIFALAVVLVAPPVEELLFRGALLRGLQRRWSTAVAVFVSALVFAAVHVIGDLGSGYVVPGLLILGLVSGYQAAKHRDLARSILLHMGFNLLAAVALVVS